MGYRPTGKPKGRPPKAVIKDDVVNLEAEAELQRQLEEAEKAALIEQEKSAPSKPVSPKANITKEGDTQSNSLADELPVPEVPKDPRKGNVVLRNFGILDDNERNAIPVLLGKLATLDPKMRKKIYTFVEENIGFDADQIKSVFERDILRLFKRR